MTKRTNLPSRGPRATRGGARVTPDTRPEHALGPEHDGQARGGNRVRARREACALPQGLLAERVGLSRQSVSAIEAGRATPGVDVALRLAQALDCRVEDLFGDAPAAPDLQAEGDTSDARSGRVTLAHIGGRWVAHGLGPEGASRSADGLRRGGTGDTHTPRVRVTPLRPLPELQDNVVLMGCGAGLGLLADLLNRLPGAGRFVWLPRTSTAALAALHAQHTHVAGVHLVDPRTGEANVADVRRVVRGQRVTLVTLGRWEAGLVVRPLDAGRVRGAQDLGRRGLRVVGRERGAGATRLLEHTVKAQGLPAAVATNPALVVSGPMDVARAIAMGAGDVGVATRDAAEALGLGFVPLTEERYDLAVSSEGLGDPRLARLFDVLSSRAFRRELGALGYDVSEAGRRAADVGVA